MIKFFITIIFCTSIILSAANEKEIPQWQRPFKAWEKNETLARSYPLFNVGYQEIRTSVESLLSKDGKANFIRSRKIVLVLDKPEAHLRLQKLFISLKSDPVNIRVAISYSELSNADRQTIGFKSRTEKSDSYTAIRQQDRNNAQQTASLLVANGHSAKLWSGETITDTRLLSAHSFVDFDSGRRLIFDLEHTEQNIGFELFFKATHLGDGFIKVETFPVITIKEGRNSRRIKSTSIQTTVYAYHGQRINLGGSNKSDKKRRSMRKFINDAFGGSISTGGLNSLTNISMVAEVVVSKKPNYKKK